MTRNGYVLITIAVLLGVAYAAFFTNLFTKEHIQIIPQIRPGRAANASRSGDIPPTYPVSFLFAPTPSTPDGKFKLTSVKVIAANELKTNKYANPAWYLVSDSNSAPTKFITYGYPVKGMKPAIARMRPEPLQPNVPYVLMVEAGRVKGQANFMTKELVATP
jgi:hypothetical protein